MNSFFPKRPAYYLFSIGIAAALFFAALPLSAQTVIGGDTIDVSAMLDVQGADKGVLLPRLTTAQRNAMPAPARGLLIFNHDENCIQINTGSPLLPAWKCLGEGLPQAGNQTGNVLYWNGTAWVRLSPGQPGQQLTLTQQGTPAWTGATFPVVSTEPITSIGFGQQYFGLGVLVFEAQVGVNVSSDGGGPLLVKGVVCDTRDNPVISDVGEYASGDTGRVFQNVSLSGPGIFRGSVPSLLPGTTYKCRGFAMNSAGIVYGNQQSFTTPSAGMVGGLNCAGATFSNDLVAGISPDGTTISIPYTGGNGGLYTSQTVSSTGLTGLTASLAAGTLSLGPGSLQYVLTGTTPVAGTANFSISFGGQSCTVSRAVLPGSGSTTDQITMKNIPGGTFSMGCTTGDANCSSYETPVYTVTLSAFQIGETEVTQAQWQAVMGSNPSYFPGNNSRPVENVSWYDVAVFCNRLSEAQGLQPCYFADSIFTQIYGKSGGAWSLPNSGNVYWNPSASGYRMPTEAEWEYAARGGNYSHLYSGSNTAGDVAWVGNPFASTYGVKGKQANAYGLYDMSGNVAEWCWDWLGYYSVNAKTNPTGASSPFPNPLRVHRGGIFQNTPESFRVSSRLGSNPWERYFGYGFRVARRDPLGAVKNGSSEGK